MATVTIKAKYDGMPAGKKVGDDIEIEERLVEELRAVGAIENVRRVLVAETGQLGASFTVT